MLVICLFIFSGVAGLSFVAFLHGDRKVFTCRVSLHPILLLVDLGRFRIRASKFVSLASKKALEAESRNSEI